MGSWQGLRSLFPWKDFTVCTPEFLTIGPKATGRSFLLSNFPYDHQVPMQIRFTIQQKKNSEQTQGVQPQLKTTKHKPFWHIFFCVFPSPLFPVVGPLACQRAAASERAPPSHVGGGGSPPRYKSWRSEARSPWTAGEVRGFGLDVWCPKNPPPSKVAISRTPKYTSSGKKNFKAFH